MTRAGNAATAISPTSRSLAVPGQNSCVVSCLSRLTVNVPGAHRRHGLAVPRRAHRGVGLVKIVTDIGRPPLVRRRLHTMMAPPHTPAGRAADNGDPPKQAPGSFSRRDWFFVLIMGVLTVAVGTYFAVDWLVSALWGTVGVTFAVVALFLLSGILIGLLITRWALRSIRKIQT